MDFPACFELREDSICFEQELDRHGVCIITEEQIETARLFFEQCPELTEGDWEGNLNTRRLLVHFRPALEYEEAEAIAKRLDLDW